MTAVDPSEVAFKFGDQGGGDDDDQDDEEKNDDSIGSDSDFQNDIEKIINYSDCNQSIKGDDVNYIGQIDALGIERK